MISGANYKTKSDLFQKLFKNLNPTERLIIGKYLVNKTTHLRGWSRFCVNKHNLRLGAKSSGEFC